MIKFYDVLGVRYRFRYYKRKIFDENGNELLGDVCHREKIIRIYLNQTPEDLKKTIIHEICHCIFTISGVGGAIHHDLEEVAVEAISQGLYALIESN